MRNAQGQFEDNFEAFLTKDGAVVPGSMRCGHNVMTNAGWNWLAQLVAMATIRDVDTEPTLDDIVASQLRVRWIGVGTGFSPESKHVSQLNSPAAVNGTPDYLKLVSPVATWPVLRAVRFVCQFDKPDLPGDPLISEAGLFADANDTGGLYGPAVTAMAATEQYAEPVAYKSFDPPLQKLTGVHNLVVRWELRF